MSVQQKAKIERVETERALEEKQAAANAATKAREEAERLVKESSLAEDVSDLIEVFGLLFSSPLISDCSTYIFISPTYISTLPRSSTGRKPESQA